MEKDEKEKNLTRIKETRWKNGGERNGAVGREPLEKQQESQLPIKTDREVHSLLSEARKHDTEHDESAK
jgi:hypothetical protein